MRTALLASAVVSPAALPGAAFADSLARPCTDRPQSDYLSLEALKVKALEHGYQIRSGEIRNACGEFYVLDDTGKIVAGDGSGGGNDDQVVAAGSAKDRGGEDKDGDDR